MDEIRRDAVRSNGREVVRAVALEPLAADVAVPGVAAVALVADDGGGGPFAMMALSRAGSRASWPDDQNK